jgi:hypothetical protein
VSKVKLQVTGFDFGKVSKVATALIDKMAALGWILFEPKQIKRLATAEVEADRIRALGKIKTSALTQRALARVVRQEERKQRNVEQITQGAIPLLDVKAKPKDVDEDWLTMLFERASLVSDVEMQSVWSRLLAGEVNQPGTFSRRTLQVVSTLEKADAYLITSLSRFVWTIGSERPSVVVVNWNDQIYADAGITFASLVHLDAIGIINFGTDPIPGGFSIQGLPTKFDATYFGSRFTAELPDTAQGAIRVGKAIFTSVGDQLAAISGAVPVEGFAEYCIGHYWAPNRIIFTHLGG